jgi:hypothetical protein
MKQYKVIIIYVIFDDISRKSFEEELEKYGLERVGTQDIFALPLEEYRHSKPTCEPMYASIWTAKIRYCSLNHA